MREGESIPDRTHASPKDGYFTACICLYMFSRVRGTVETAANLKFCFHVGAPRSASVSPLSQGLLTGHRVSLGNPVGA